MYRNLCFIDQLVLYRLAFVGDVSQLVLVLYRLAFVGDVS